MLRIGALVDLDDSSIESAGFEQNVRSINRCAHSPLGRIEQNCLGAKMSLKGGDQ
jgi:hypothetical protein